MLLNKNSNFLHVFNRKINSIRFLNSLIRNIKYFNFLYKAILYCLGTYINCKGHESISAIVKVKLYLCLI